MKTKPVILFFLLVLAAGLPHNLAAGQNTVSFVIAPPPVGYPEFQKGTSVMQIGLTGLYLGIDVLGTKLDMLGGGGFLLWQYSLTDSLALNAAGGFSLAGASKYEMAMFSVPMGASVVLKVIDLGPASLMAFGGGGVNLGMTYMTIPTPQLVGFTVTTDYPSYETKIVQGSLQGGLQVNITGGPFIISPFGFISWNGGSFELTAQSAMSFEYPKISGSLDGITATIFGIDILHTPSKIALSSMIRKKRDYTLITVSTKISL